MLNEEKLYNLIIHGNSQFWSGNNGYVDFPKERFLEHTEDPLKNQFQALDQDVINRLIELPTLFAVEQERIETRIGKVTKIEVLGRTLRVYYQFSEQYYPLKKGVLEQNWQKLNINNHFEFYRTHWAIKECDISAFYNEYLKTLTGLAHQLKNTNKKVQLIYGFNGMGKTRLSREFKDLIAPKNDDDEVETTVPVIYYNAFTEDLFYWDNDLTGDTERKLKIQPNAYTRWVLQEQGQDRNAIAHFQRYTSDKLTPKFSEDFSEVTFSFERGNDEKSENIKISKGEESNFIWSIFYSLIEQIISTLNTAEASERDTDRYAQLEYVFIDDPVSSLDENHLIELAVNLATLIKSSQSDLKFIISMHNPLFYNVLYNEIKNKGCYLLERFEDGTFGLSEKDGDSNKSFSYHLYLKQTLEHAIANNQVQKYHFTLLRNLYEKTSSFLGYKQWTDLLETAPGDKGSYLKRIINFSSHRTLSNEEVAEPTEPEKQTVKLLLDNLTKNYGYWPKQEKQND